uniref:Uncharacterized protein ybeQ n=1 Tax=Lygus hesperus TaxID=30085 RepID=A0A0A9X5M7_LYGHE
MGQPNSMFNLGWSYASGMGVPQSWKHAIRWWKLACLYGHGSAARNLGLLHTLGMIDDADDAFYDTCPIDKLELYQKYNGFYYYLRAAELGNVKGMMALENCYRHGIGCKRDSELADLWYRRVIDAGATSASLGNAVCAKSQSPAQGANHSSHPCDTDHLHDAEEKCSEDLFRGGGQSLYNHLYAHKPV